jgi:hypothetical protein
MYKDGSLKGKDMADKDNSALEYLKAITAEGKTISINIKILDTKKAKKLLFTMYGKNIDIFGVEVQSWGFWDIIGANKLRLDQIKEEVERHRSAIADLMSKYDQDFLEAESTK